MMHQAFLVGAMYELDLYGQITKQLFENLNTRFYQSSGAHKFVSMVYGEVSEEATFRFISAAQPTPCVFSRRHDRLMDIEPELRATGPPIGLLPSLDVIDRSTNRSVLGFKEGYTVNEWVLMGAGDILLLHTDGLSDHTDEGGASYVPGRLEHMLRCLKHMSARNIYEALRSDVLAFGRPSDDITMVVVKRTSGRSSR